MSIKIKISLFLITLLLGFLIVVSVLKDSANSESTSIQPPLEIKQRKDSKTSITDRLTTRKLARQKKLQEAEDAKMSLPEIKKALTENCSADTKIMLIGNLSGNYSDNALKLLNSLLDDDSQDVRCEAMDMIADFENEKILPSIEKALNDTNEDVRLSAVNAIGELNAGALIAKAVDDKSENVRDAAIDIIEDSSDEIKLDICQYGIHSPYSDVQEKTVSILSDITSKRTVDILIDGLRLDNKELQDEIKSELEYCLDKEFKNYKQAAAWWKKNSNRYTNSLDEKEE
jgi:HEAT repeat protein